MNNKVLQALLHKYRTNSISPEEKKKLEAWYQKFDSKADFLDSQSPEQLHHLEENMLAQIHERIEKGAPEENSTLIGTPNPYKRSSGFWLQAAAILVGVSLIAALVYAYSYSPL